MTRSILAFVSPQKDPRPFGCHRPRPPLPFLLSPWIWSHVACVLGSGFSMRVMSSKSIQGSHLRPPCGEEEGAWTLCPPGGTQDSLTPSSAARRVRFHQGEGRGEGLHFQAHLEAHRPPPAQHQEGELDLCLCGAVTRNE
jgi:hypothetical protein